ncbi:hypothetical protein LAZ67_11000280 [Cordylochernes scorpioides]|uniref:Uncharacterized protein n=1 Tax=Cordylochernes scorpioides TaxID=51811 RepID=A0ABY6L013_9ARAC|nr:hypothetical protein LAZ67_11000280 [Cordylochernes scorpioides]
MSPYISITAAAMSTILGVYTVLLLLSCPMKSLRCLHTSLSQQSAENLREISCQVMATALQKIDMDLEQQLYTPKIVDIEKIKQKIRNDQICEINSERKLTKTITRLRTKHYKGITIHPDSTRTYRTCNNCPGVELTPTHIFSCPAMTAALQKIDMDPEQQLYSPKIVDIAAAVIEMYGDI